jgi:NodT family efflux transporter outer membrane factor (OMF) lipoprotein
VLLGVVLGGCVSPPSELPTRAPIAVEALGLSGQVQLPVADGWWRAYRDPQLDRIVERAIEGNPLLDLALARLREADARIGAARGPLYPGFSLDATEQRSRLSEHDVIPPPYGGRWIWRGEVAVNLSWDLDFWGRQASIVQAASANADAAALDRETARLVLAGALSRSYMQLDHAYRALDLAQRTLSLREAEADLVRKRVDAGLDTTLELRRAQGAVPSARVQVSEAQAAIERAVHALATLSGQGAASYGEIVRPTLDPDVAPPLPAALPANLLARRPDVIAARWRIEASDARRLAARAAFYPDVDLSAFAGFGAIGLDKLFVGDSLQMGIGPRLHLPLFDARRLKAEYREANAAVDAAVAQYNATVLFAVQQVADQLTALQAAQREQVDEQLALEHAQDVRRIAAGRQRAGLGTRLQVLDAEAGVIQAQRSLLDRREALSQARVALLLSLGGSFDPDAPSTIRADVAQVSP